MKNKKLSIVVVSLSAFLIYLVYGLLDAKLVLAQCSGSYDCGIEVVDEFGTSCNKSSSRGCSGATENACLQSAQCVDCVASYNCVWQGGGGGGGGECGNCSAGKCQDGDIGDPCGNGGTCKKQGSNTCGDGKPQCSCQGQGGTPSCTAVLTPSSSTIFIDSAEVFTASVSTSNGTVSEVRFTSSDTNALTVTSPDTFSPYTTTATANSAGTPTITVQVLMGGIIRCSDVSSVTVPAPSCTVDLTPSITTFSTGVDNTFTASIVPTGGTVERVDFASGNTSVVTVNPASDTTSVYSTIGTGVGVGSTTITSNVFMAGVQRCTDFSDVTIIFADPWWQTRDLDILSSGNIASNIPGSCSGACTPNLILDGDGGYPGAAVYSGSLDPASGQISSTLWNADTTLSQSRQYKYALFERIVSTNIVFNDITAAQAPGGVIDGNVLEALGSPSEGYYWYMYDAETLGDLTIDTNDADFASRKAVLFVKGGNLNINKAINFTDGTGFFMAIVGKDSSGAEGNINISSGVGGTTADLEGMYVADGAISTGTAGVVNSDIPLTIRGSLAAYGGVNLQRDLVDDSVTPAEFIDFGADILLNFPKELRVKSYRWEEVAP